MASDWLPAVFGLAGAALGAFGSYVASARAEDKRFAREDRLASAQRERDLALRRNELEIAATSRLETTLNEMYANAARTNLLQASDPDNAASYVELTIQRERLTGLAMSDVGRLGADDLIGVVTSLVQILQELHLCNNVKMLNERLAECADAMGQSMLMLGIHQRRLMSEDWFTIEVGPEDSGVSPPESQPAGEPA